MGEMRQEQYGKDDAHHISDLMQHECVQHSTMQ
jgi:hypothetical protein